jgi:hypothetical protein
MIRPIFLVLQLTLLKLRPTFKLLLRITFIVKFSLGTNSKGMCEHKQLAMLP